MRISILMLNYLQLSLITRVNDLEGQVHKTT